MEQGLALLPKYIMNFFWNFQRGYLIFWVCTGLVSDHYLKHFFSNQYCMMMFCYNLQRTTESARGDRLRFVCAAVDICLQFD